VSWHHMHKDGSIWNHTDDIECQEGVTVIKRGEYGDGPKCNCGSYSAESGSRFAHAEWCAQVRYFNGLPYLVSVADDNVPGPDPLVEHPSHYNNHPSGFECWDVVRHMNFNLGSAMKYLWRCDEKGTPIRDLQKAVKHIQDEIAMRKKAAEDV